MNFNGNRVMKRSVLSQTPNWVEQEAPRRGTRRTEPLHTEPLRGSVLGVVVVLLCLVCDGALSWAQENESIPQNRTVTVAHDVVAPFDPEEAMMVFATGEGALEIASGAIARTAIQGEVKVTSRIVLPESVSSLRVLSILKSREGKWFSAMTEIPSLTADPLLLLDASELSSRLTERRNVLQSWRVRLTEQESNLQRLQDDADVIVNVGRIITAEDELVSLKQDIERLSLSLSAARSRLEAVNQADVPSYFVRREAALAAELNELTKTLKSTEAAALKKVSSASQELQEKLALIEATKYQQIDPLLKELNILRRERMELEAARGVSPSD